MTRRWVVGVATALAVSPVASTAQLSDGGRIELGAGALYSRYDPGRLPFADNFGVRLRAAWFFTRSLSMEASASRTLTGDRSLAQGVEMSEFAATVLATVPAGGYNRLFAGIGYSFLTHIGAADFNDHAMHAVIGDRIPLSRMAALRVEGRGIYTPQSNAPGGGGRAFSMTFSAGVSLFIDAIAPRDSDIDLVPDRSDLCAATPAAVAVDVNGCPRDSDTDGVFDGLDLCMVTEPGAPVGTDGCVLDADLDGVADHRDACPATDPGLEVNSRGCPLDTDQDGVADDFDRCPGTPTNVEVDGTGCVLDGDADGVPDHLDRCPGTSEELQVDAFGCQVLFNGDEEGERQPLVLRGVNFELSETVLTPESYGVLDQVAASLVANPEVRVEVAGHTDASGVAGLNVPLSLARAEVVRDYLVSQGVAPNRLEPRGYGADQPVAENDTDEGRAQNRRVELRLIEP